MNCLIKGNKYEASSVKINDEEYSVNSRGLNIVVYDKEAQKVVSSVCFDLYSEITLYLPTFFSLP